MVALQDPPMANGSAPTVEAADQLADFEDAEERDASAGGDGSVRAAR